MQGAKAEHAAGAKAAIVANVEGEAKTGIVAAAEVEAGANAKAGAKVVFMRRLEEEAKVELAAGAGVGAQAKPRLEERGRRVI